MRTDIHTPKRCQSSFIPSIGKKVPAPLGDGVGTAITSYPSSARAKKAQVDHLNPLSGCTMRSTHVTSAGFLPKMCTSMVSRKQSDKYRPRDMTEGTQLGHLKKVSDIDKNQREVNCSIKDITKS